MALPRRKVSRTRGRKRRTHWKMKAPNLIPCPNCGTLILPHRVCPNCHQYKGKEMPV